VFIDQSPLRARRRRHFRRDWNRIRTRRRAISLADLTEIISVTGSEFENFGLTADIFVGFGTESGSHGERSGRQIADPGSNFITFGFVPTKVIVGFRLFGFICGVARSSEFGIGCAK
jgi:hypothetical protein